jgi:vacuolar-type H+-ATPase subunit B/Vma2
MINQPERRTLDESFAVGWALLRTLPAAELTRLKPEQIAHYLTTTHV